MDCNTHERTQPEEKEINKKKQRWRRITYSIFVAIAILIYVLCQIRMEAAQAFYESYYKTKIPASIELLEPIFVYAADTWGFRPDEYYDPRAVAVYRISDNTAFAIKNEGLNFLQGAQLWREMPDWIGRRSWSGAGIYTYLPWKRSPVPEGWIGEGPWGFCFPDDSPSETGSWMKSAQKEGSFYTQAAARDGSLVIIPDLKVVIYCYVKF
jgi:hypothetical protein